MPLLSLKARLVARVVVVQTHYANTLLVRAAEELQHLVVLLAHPVLQVGHRIDQLVLLQVLVGLQMWLTI